MFRRNYVAVLRSDLRYRLATNHYLTLMGNYSRDFNSFRQFENGEDNWGVGMSYAYDSVVGPLKGIVHWSSMTHTVGLFVSLGFDF
jgi:NTE family protein